MSMYPKNMFFTSESVTEGHPDKLCEKGKLGGGDAPSGKRSNRSGSPNC